MRCSTPRAAMAGPANSTAYPAPASAPRRAMASSMRSLGSTPGANAPLKVILIIFGRRCTRLWVASTRVSSLVPTPNPRAPNPPLVQVWLSPHTTVAPGRVSPSSGPMTWTIPCSGESMSNNLSLCAAKLRRMSGTKVRLRSLLSSVRPDRMVTLCSGDPKVSSGERTSTARSASVVKAWGEVTSCTRWRSTCRTSSPSPSSVTTCWSQILPTSVRPPMAVALTADRRVPELLPSCRCGPHPRRPPPRRRRWRRSRCPG
jgi:hypothetical protein